MHWDSRWLWQGNTRDKQVWWWMNLTARWMVAAEVALREKPQPKLMLNSFWGKSFFFSRWRRLMSHPGNAIGYHGIMDKRHCRNNWWLLVPRSNQCVDITSLYPWVKKKTRQKWKQGVCLLNLYGWRKEHWTKGAAGTGSVDQQAAERHW